MALFHALLSADLGLPPSRFYEHALDYFRGPPGWDQWSFVGYQGIADVACRHDDEPLTTAIAHLPSEPLVALCHCLESRPLSARAGRGPDPVACNRPWQQQPPDIPLLAALIRGLSRAADSPGVTKAIRQEHPRYIRPAAISRSWPPSPDARWETLADAIMLKPICSGWPKTIMARPHSSTASATC